MNEAYLSWHMTIFGTHGNNCGHPKNSDGDCFTKVGWDAAMRQMEAKNATLKAERDLAEAKCAVLGARLERYEEPASSESNPGQHLLDERDALKARVVRLERAARNAMEFCYAEAPDGCSFNQAQGEELEAALAIEPKEESNAR